MFRNKDQLTKLEEAITELQGQVRALARNTNKAHNRIDQANLRTANIEHYTGMRSHSFEKGGRMWDYMQIHKDIASGTRPKSLFVTKHRIAQAA